MATLLMDIFFILHYYISPILAFVVFPAIILLFYFAIMSSISRQLTWDRFRKIAYQFLEDDTGNAYLVRSKEVLPEGVIITKDGNVRFLPRATFKKNKTEETEDLEGIATRKIIWRDMNKPITFGYAGKIASVNLATLAALLHGKDKVHPLVACIAQIKELITGSKLPQKSLDVINPLLEKAVEFTTFKHYRTVDLTKIKSVLSKMYTPSQISAYGKNREMKGMLKAGKQMLPYILGIGLIIALVILGVYAFSMVGR